MRAQRPPPLAPGCGSRSPSLQTSLANGYVHDTRRGDQAGARPSALAPRLQACPARGPPVPGEEGPARATEQRCPLRSCRCLQEPEPLGAATARQAPARVPRAAKAPPPASAAGTAPSPRGLVSPAPSPRQTGVLDHCPPWRHGPSSPGAREGLTPGRGGHEVHGGGWGREREAIYKRPGWTWRDGTGRKPPGLAGRSKRDRLPGLLAPGEPRGAGSRGGERCRGRAGAGAVWGRDTWPRCAGRWPLGPPVPELPRVLESARPRSRG